MSAEWKVTQKCLEKGSCVISYKLNESTIEDLIETLEKETSLPFEAISSSIDLETKSRFVTVKLKVKK